MFTMHSDNPITLEVGENLDTNLEQSATSMILRE